MKVYAYALFLRFFWFLLLYFDLWSILINFCMWYEGQDQLHSFACDSSCFEKLTCQVHAGLSVVVFTLSMFASPCLSPNIDNVSFLFFSWSVVLEACHFYWFFSKNQLLKRLIFLYCFCFQFCWFCYRLYYFLFFWLIWVYVAHFFS